MACRSQVNTPPGGCCYKLHAWHAMLRCAVLHIIIIVHVRLQSVTDKVQFEKMIRSSEYIDKFINSCNKFQKLLTLGALCLMPKSHTRSTMGGSKMTPGISLEPRHLETKFQRLLPIFEVKLFNSANVDFISRDLIPEINMATIKMQA
jgi:hypothetical protein